MDIDQANKVILPETTWPEMSDPTPEQFRDWLAGMSRDQLLAFCTKSLGLSRLDLECHVMGHNLQIKHLNFVVAERNMRIARALAINPEAYANGSRDFGRGFSHAMMLVRGVLKGEGA